MDLFERPVALAISPAMDVTAPILTIAVAIYIATIPVTPSLTMDLRVPKLNPFSDLRLDDLREDLPPRNLRPVLPRNRMDVRLDLATICIIRLTRKKNRLVYDDKDYS